MKITIKILAFATVVLLMNCQKTTSPDTTEIKSGMVKVTILYPNNEGKTFDMDYYKNKHMPMVARLLGDSLRVYKIDKGLAGRTPEEPIPYVAIGYLYFDQLSAYQNSFGPNAKEIVGDIPNYTNIQPVLQISEVVE